MKEKFEGAPISIVKLFSPEPLLSQKNSAGAYEMVDGMEVPLSIEANVKPKVCEKSVTEVWLIVHFKETKVR